MVPPHCSLLPLRAYVAITIRSEPEPPVEQDDRAVNRRHRLVSCVRLGGQRSCSLKACAKGGSHGARTRLKEGRSMSYKPTSKSMAAAQLRALGHALRPNFGPSEARVLRCRKSPAATAKILGRGLITRGQP